MKWEQLNREQTQHRLSLHVNVISDEWVVDASCTSAECWHFGGGSKAEEM